jgi:hypothetical protein
MSNLTIQKKKDQEEYIIKKFISHKKLNLPVFAVIGNETPDFIIKGPQGTYSIELTRLIDPEIKETEVLQEKIVNGARELFIKKYEENLRVWVTFNDLPITLTKKNESIYYNELFEIVERVYLSNKDFQFETKSKKQINPTHHIEDIYISNKAGFCNWQTFGAFIVSRPDFKIIDDVINSKEKGLNKYKQDFKENWLVIAANFGKRSGAYDFLFIDDYKANTKFDKVFIYNLRENEIINIKTENT